MAISAPPALPSFKNCTRCRSDCCIRGGDGAFDASNRDGRYGGFDGEDVVSVDSRAKFNEGCKRKPDCRRFDVALRKVV
jgi:hypothetical protein